MKFAQKTDVPSDRSRSEIERTLMRYGADAFMYGWQGEKAVISFKMGNRLYRIKLPLPSKEDFSITPERRFQRSPEAQIKVWEQASRQRWRALALWVKAVLEAAESEITTLEEALQPFTLLPDGSTVGEWMAPQIEQAWLKGKMPQLLPMLEHK